jgi:hypothetical protein
MTVDVSVLIDMQQLSRISFLIKWSEGQYSVISLISDDIVKKMWRFSFHLFWAFKSQFHFASGQFSLIGSSRETINHIPYLYLDSSSFTFRMKSFCIRRFHDKILFCVQINRSSSKILSKQIFDPPVWFFSSTSLFRLLSDFLSHFFFLPSFSISIPYLPFYNFFFLSNSFISLLNLHFFSQNLPSPIL